MADKMQEVVVGLIAGQVLTLKLSEAEYDNLVEGLTNESPWLKVDTDEAEFVVDVNKIAYIRRASREPSVGFAGS